MLRIINILQSYIHTMETCIPHNPNTRRVFYVNQYWYVNLLAYIAYRHSTVPFHSGNRHIKHVNNPRPKFIKSFVTTINIIITFKPMFLSVFQYDFKTQVLNVRNIRWWHRSADVTQRSLNCVKLSSGPP